MKNALVLILCLSAAPFGFDGGKTGFFLGAGAGPGFTTFDQEVTGSPNRPQQNTLALATDFFIGYGFTPNFVLTYFSNTNWFSTQNIFGRDPIISNGISGLGGFYFFNKTAEFKPSAYAFGGLGWSDWSTPFETRGAYWLGAGITGGAGYEFAKHWGVQLNVFATNPSATSEGNKLQANSVGLQLSLVTLAY